MSAEHVNRRGFFKVTGGAAVGVAASTYLGGPAAAAARDVADAGAATGGNPIIKDIYTADPDAFVFGGRLYVDTDRDQAPLGATDFVMTDWHVYSTTDAEHWTDHGVRMSLSDFAWADRNAWAPQMVHRDGKFFWYVPVRKASTGTMSIAVAVGDSPLGPFTDALGHPLIDETVANHSAFDIDPTVLVDDDGQAYIYWGSFSAPRAAKLKASMVELDDLGEDGTGGQATGPRVAGRIGKAVKLNGAGDHIALPDGVACGLGDFTIAAWVNPAATPTWSRIFDFGAGTSVYMFLTVSAGAGPRFAITTGGNGAEQQLNGTARLRVGAWTHVAVTHDGATGTLYVNGVAVATNTGMTLRPDDLGVTTGNWIGRSQFADPFLNATVDDFHIYGHALGNAEILALAGGQAGAGDVAAYRFDEDGGAVSADSSGNGHDATIVSPIVNVVTPQGLTGYWEAPFLFKRKGVYYLAYARANPATGGNPATIDYATADHPLGPWTHRGRVLSTVTNTTTNHCAIVEYGGRWYVVYHNGMLPGGGEFRRSVCVDELFFEDDGTIREVVQTLGPQAREPVAWYRFDERGGDTAEDSASGDRPGSIVGGAPRVPGVLGRAVHFDGAGQHVALPTGITWNMYDFTLAGWVKLDTADGHIVDFGDGATVNMYLTPNGSTGPVRFAITTGGAAREQHVDGTGPLRTGRWTHVAVTKSALVATLYVNGAQVGQNTGLGLYPARLGNTPNNWIGRSQYLADPFLKGAVDDFRVYQRGLPAGELAGIVAPGLINGLIDHLEGQDVPRGVEHALAARLRSAFVLLRAGHPTRAMSAIDGFVRKVEALRGSGLSDALATDLVTSAQQITATITASTA